jgi:hypothetical protein
MYLDYYGAVKIARTLAANAGLSVKFEDESKPRTDGKSIYVQKPNALWGKESWVRWWAGFYHEIGHNVPAMRDCFVLQQAKQIHMKSFLGILINIIDDYRQEYFEHDLYRGKQVIMSQSTGTVLRSILNGPNWANPKADEQWKKIEAALAYDTDNREEWMPDTTGLGQKMYDSLSPQHQEWLDKLRAGDYDLNSMKTAEDVYTMACRYIDEVFGGDSNKELEKAQAMAAAAKGKLTGEPADGEGKGKGEKSKGGDELGDVSKILRHAHYKAEDGYDTMETSRSPMHITYDSFDDGNYTPSVTAKEVNFYAGETLHGGFERWVQRDIEGMDAGRGLSNKIRRLLQIKSKAKYHYGKKSGKVAGRNLYRLGIKDGGGFAERVFRQKEQNNILDDAVSILCDFSGSMGDEKVVHASYSAILLNEVLQRLNVNHEILGFTYGGRTPYHYIFKPFGAKVTRERLTHYFAQGASNMSSNADGESILWAYHRLIQQPNPRKLLIVLSDGQPAGGGSGIVSFTKKTIEEIERQKLIEIYGIGIMDDNVQNFYTNWAVIKHADELEGALLTLISEYIINK